MKHLICSLFGFLLLASFAQAQSITLISGKNSITIDEADKENRGNIERKFFSDSTLILRLNDFSAPGELNKWTLLFTYKGRGRMGEFLPFRGNTSLVIPEFNKYIRHSQPVSVLITIVSASRKSMKVMLNVVDEK